MAEKINMAKIEKKMYGSLFNDGALDILLGLFVLGLGLSMLLEGLRFGISEVLMLYMVIPAFVVYFVLVFFVTNPRKGVMRLPEETKRSKTKLLSLQAVWLFLALIAGLYFFTQPVQAGIWNDFFVSLGWIVGSIVLFSIMAYTLKIDRFYIYGLLFATVFPFRVFMKNTFFEISTLMFFVVAIVILVWGTLVLRRFIKNTPKTGKEA